MRRILHITSRSDYGGGPEHLYQLVKGISSAYKIYIACPNEEPYYAKFSQYAECLEIPHRSVSVASVISLIRFVRANGIDLIHSHGKGAGFYARVIGVICRKPVVHSFHGVHYSHLSPVTRFFYLNAERLLSMATDRFINATEAERLVCVDAHLSAGARSVVIPNGVDVPAFRRKKPSGLFRIINVSRLEPIKGVDILLDIVAELSLSTSSFEVLIAGDGSQRAALEKRAVELGIADRVRFLGYVPDVMPLMDSADIYLSASRGEGMPLAPLEAMARSLPLVASDVIGNRDIVIDGHTGFLFDINSPKQAAEKILALMKDRGFYNSISKNGYDSAKDRYSVERMCEKTSAVYDSVLRAVPLPCTSADALSDRRLHDSKPRVNGSL